MSSVLDKDTALRAQHLSSKHPQIQRETRIGNRKRQIIRDYLRLIND